VTTLYTAVGDVFVWLCMAILAVVVLFVITRPRAMSMDGRQPA
jgi:apolipoprotein N-acyltransferase